MNKLELQKIANEVRKDIVTAVHAAKAGHPGGSLSAADLFTYLYFEEMNIDPKEPKKADRDRFVLSKGHTAPGLYSVLAERGYFPKEDLKTLVPGTFHTQFVEYVEEAAEGFHLFLSCMFSIWRNWRRRAVSSQQR